MESKESKTTSRSSKKAELKQRILSAFNSTQIEKELIETKIAKNSTFITSKKEKLLQLINEKCLDKFKFKQISNEPNLQNCQVTTSPNETTSIHIEVNTANLIKPVALRPKKNVDQHFQINTNSKRTSVDLTNMHENRINNDLLSLVGNSVNPKDESLVFSNRTNRNSRFVDRRRLNAMSMHNFNDNNLIKNAENFKDQKSKQPTNDQSDLTKNLIASTVSEITNYFANSENLFEQPSSTRPHLNLIKMKIQNLIENTNNSMTNVNDISQGNSRKKCSQEKKVFGSDRAKKESQLNCASNEENQKVKMRNKSKRNQISLSSVSTWRSSPSLNLFATNFEDTKIDLDRIESDLN